MFLALIGPPGSGKTTLGAYIGHQEGCVHITTSDRLRQTPEAMAYIERGELVPDELSCRVLLDTFTTQIARSDGYVLDGFPRERSNLEWLEDSAYKPDLYVVIDTDYALCKTRCQERGRHPIDVIETRLNVYKKAIHNGLLDSIPVDRRITVSGTDLPEIVYERIRQKINNNTPPPPLPPVIRKIVVGVQTGRAQTHCLRYWREHFDTVIQATSVPRRLFFNHHSRYHYVHVKPRDAARLLQQNIIDAFVGFDDFVNCLPTGQDHSLQPLFTFDLEHPHTPIAGDHRSRLALVTRVGASIDAHSTIVSEYPHARRYFPDVNIVDVTGSAESMLSLHKYAGAVVVVETGETLRANNLVIAQHLRYIQCNVWTNTTTATGWAFFKKHTNRMYGTRRLEGSARVVPVAHALFDAPLDDVTHLTDEEFGRLPLVIKGHSKEVRYLGYGLVVIRFLPTIYSFTHNRAATVPGSDTLRLQASREFVEILRQGGIPHAYIQVTDKWVLAHLVVPHDSEYAKYDLPAFAPHDLTAAQFAALPRAPPVEVIIKRFHSGTSKHRYKGMQGLQVRPGHPMAGVAIHDEDAYPQTLVRFDWRNPLTWVDPKTDERARVADEILPRPVAEWMIDTGGAEQLALRLHSVLQRALDQVDIVCMDLCLFVTEDGSMVYGEISQDCGRFRHFSLGSLDKDVWRSGGSADDVLAKWRLLHEHIARIVPTRVPAVIPSLLRPLIIVVGTTNPYKLREFTSLSAHLPCTIVPMSVDVPEPYDTFAENATAKRVGYQHALIDKAITYDVLIVEDSGLIVDALGGLPGARSARYTVEDEATERRTREQIDRDNNARVMAEMQGKDNRAAKFVVSGNIAYQGMTRRFERETTGTIAAEMHGNGGFGYDPLFVGDNTDGHTYAELDACRKNLRSHRTLLYHDMIDWLVLNWT